jgi:hypothetical protein
LNENVTLVTLILFCNPNFYFPLGAKRAILEPMGEGSRFFDEEMVEVTCSFCGKAASSDRVFRDAEDSAGRSGCICHDCVRNLYIAMIAAEMRPPLPIRSITPVRSRSARAQVIPLYPRKDQ